MSTQKHICSSSCADPANHVRGRHFNNRCVRKLTASSATKDLAGQEPDRRIVYAVAAASGHDKEGHPECAARIPAIEAALESAQLTQAARPQQLTQLRAFRPASFEEVTAIHSEKYVTQLQKLVSSRVLSQLDGDTYATRSSYDDALQASGAAIAIIDAVVCASSSKTLTGQPAGGSTCGFGICRPPGHHSLPAAPMGFCLLSTVAIATRYCQQAHGLNKVMIFDFDVHHGNGTHDTFIEDDSVLFVSTHQANTFPFMGALHEVGTADGSGYSINLPLPGDSGDAAILAAFEEIVEPAARRFCPDIILVSAGFDAHWRDPLAGLQLRTSSFHALSTRLAALSRELCDGRLVMLLEGGYDLKALGESVSDSFRGMLGEQSLDKFNPDLLREEPLDKVRAMLKEARVIHGL